MDCQEAKYQLSAYTDKEISQEQMSLIAAHVEICQMCRMIIIIQKRISAAFAAEEKDLPARLGHDFVKQLAREMKSKPQAEELT